jgi:hypothetical protein
VLASSGLVVLAWLGLSCGPSDGAPTGPVVLDETPPPEVVAVARDTADALGAELVAVLFRELESGNPIDAIEICAIRAQEMSAVYSEQGLKVRRVSRRFRNPANEPDAYEYRKLRELQALHDRGELPVETADVVLVDDVRILRYMKPIVFKPPCAICHGRVSEIDDDVLDVILSSYPGDRAIGFSVDDLRGAFSVEIEL